MDLMQQRLLEELRRRQIVASPVQATDPSIVPLDLAPPPPTVAADPSIVPAGLAPPPPLSAMPDNSTAMGDLQKGGLGLAAAVPALQLRAGQQAIIDRKSDTSIGPGAAAGWRADADAFEAELENVRAADPEAAAALEEQIVALRLKADDAIASRDNADGRSRAAMADAAVSLNDYNTRAAAIPMNPATERMMDPNSTWADAFAAILADPGGVARTLALQTTPNLVPAVAGGVVGSAVGGPIVAALGAGSASAATEYGSSVSQALTKTLQDAGINPTDGKAVAAWAEANPGVFDQITSDARVRAAIIGTVDAASGGIGGKIAEHAVGGSLAARIAAPVAGAGVEAVGGGAGEASAQLATTGQVSPGDVLAEIIGGGAVGGPMVAGQMVAETFRGKPKTQAPAAGGVVPPDMAPPPPGAAAPADTPPPGAAAETPPTSPGEATAETTPAASNLVPPDLAPPPPTEAAPVAVDGEPVAATPTAQAEPVAEPGPPPSVETAPTEQVAAPTEQVAAPTEQVAAPTEQVAAPTEQVAAPTEQVPARGATPDATPVNPRRSKVFTPDNEEIEVETTVVEADSLVSSDNPNYPQDLQPRDRERAASEIQIEGIANKPNPARLDQSPESDRGAPIVGPDGATVESGNGRVIGLRRGYERGSAEAYRAYVNANYPEAAGMKNPVIVRRRVTDVNVQDFTVASNQSATLQMSAGENAKTDARSIDDDVLGQYRGGEIGSTANRPMVLAFIGRLPKTVQNALTTKEGGLSIEGVRRFQAALFTRAYGESNLLSRLTENPDDDIRSVTNALADSAPLMAQVRGEIEAGRVSPDVDLSPDLLAATQIMADMRTRGQSLWDYRDQADAFAAPNSPATDAILDAFFAGDGKRMVSRKAMQGFLSFYAQGAMAQRIDQATMPGVEPVPLKTTEGLVADAASKTWAATVASETPRLLDAPSGGRKGASGGGRADARGAREQRAYDDSSREDPVGDDESALADEYPTKVPRGGATPAFEAASQSSEPSIFEGAYRDAGITPDEGVLMAPMARVAMLSKLLSGKFGFKAVARATGSMKLRANDATDQLLDAYRGAAMMLHVLGLPEKALGLGGSLSLTLEKFKGRYLGMYDGSTRTIHVPGRSNSFAHEWFHALDHFLRDKLTPLGESHLLTKVARSEGLVDPRTSLENAFVNLINKMFFDEAALAHRMLGLESTAAKVDKQGNPTKGALDAAEQLEKLAAGNTRIRVKPSAYRSGSQAYSPRAADYFGSVHEMAARAFEAFIAHKMEMANAGASNFISKGEAAYLSDADRRLELTFPKALERMAIFDAFDAIFDHMRLNEDLGPGPVADRPADTDLADPAFWTKFALGLKTTNVASDIMAEFRVMATGLAKLALHPFASLKSTTSALALNTGLANSDGQFSPKVAIMQVARSARWLASSMRGFAKAHIKRAPPGAQEILRYVMAPVMTDPGTMHGQRQTIEEKTETSVARASAEITASLTANGVSANPTKTDNDTLRALMYGENVPSTAKMKAVAATLRRAMDKAYAAAVKAGIEMDYIEEKGYLPRVLNSTAVEDNRDGFAEKATEVYQIYFDNITDEMGATDLLSMAAGVSAKFAPMANGPNSGPFGAEMKALRAAVNALRKAAKPTPGLTAALDAAREALVGVMRTPYAETSARSWMERALIGDGSTFDSLGPYANFKQTRGLPSEADDILADFYETDVFALVHDYLHSTAKRAAYQSEYGTSGGADRLDQVLNRPDVQGEVRKNPTKYNTSTPAGRLNIIKDLANPRTDDIKEILLNEALKAGTASETITQLRSTIESVTGRVARAKIVGYGDRLATAVYVIGTLALLPKAVWTAVAEPTTFLLRTGNLKTSMKVLGIYAREAFRGAKSVKELAALAEMVGVVTSPLHDTLMLNRMGDGNEKSTGSVILSRFFRATFLAQITNAQRRAVLAGSFYWMRDLARTVQDGSGATAKIARAEFRDVGVAEADIDAFAKWLVAKDGLPSLDDLNTREGQQFAASGARLTDQTIQNPRRADKAQAVLTPMGRLAFGLTSFIYTFYRNVHAATVLRAGRNAEIRQSEGQSKMEAVAKSYGEQGVRLAAGFAVIYVAQMLAGIPRALAFDSEQWDEKEKDGQLGEWLGGLAASRTGVLGPLDVVYNAITGLRYERDLTSMAAGAHLGYFISQTQNVVSMFGARNSPNTNTAERTAVKGLYRLLAAPGFAALLSAIPAAGPVSKLARFGVLEYLTSNSAGSDFATAVAGPKKAK